MVKLSKTNSDFCHNCVELTTDEGSFKMYLNPDFNLFINPVIHQESSFDDIYKYTITKDNRYVYALFEKLYNSVMSGKFLKSLNYETEDIVLGTGEFSLVKDSGIEWHSDGFEYDAASVLRIDKNKNDNYVVAFKGSKVVSDDISSFMTFAVQIDYGNKSRYFPYNNLFIELYKELMDYDLFHNLVLYNNGISNKIKVRKR